MESDLQQHPTMFLDHQNHHQQQMNSGLTRFKSAPSSYFSNIIDKEFYEHLFNRPSSPETERVFARFMNSLSGSGSGGGGGDAESVSVSVSASASVAVVDDSLTQNLQQQLPIVKEEIDQQSQTMTSMNTNNNNETMNLQQLQRTQSNMNSYGSSTPQNFYQSSGRPPLPNSMKTGRGNCSNLIRHGSSPAGLFSNINIETGFAAMRGIGSMGAASSTSKEAKFSSAVRLKNASNYSSVLGAEIGSSSIPPNNPEPEGFAETRGNDFIPGFPLGTTWEDTAMISDNITGVKRYRDDDDVKPFSAGLNPAETKNETGGQPPTAPLAHQMSLPNTTAELAAIEKFLQFSDSVPCKIRAKRGCATHPRSIAERVRRTKISERMRKLQDLVPNMDKQTNTSDMLDLAVEYIKDLQNQVETLSDSRAKCTCPHKP
ncbi:hypothetical protein TSUD_413200 [Trifolium subterraneum]|uniref:BHLH domain-containing protein n=1 Tax=Trifolium subterraneum TaxID=3900 RepID=A0A2Z6PUD9_TRISU|nr:hypothetical protein TSUD_413200 [Trifolium subterraneum]